MPHYKEGGYVSRDMKADDHKSSASPKEGYRGDAKFASGGASRGRATDFKKEPDTRFGAGNKAASKSKDDSYGAFLGGRDKFTGRKPDNQAVNEEGWVKGKDGADLSSRFGDDKSERAIKPRK